MNCCVFGNSHTATRPAAIFRTVVEPFNSLTAKVIGGCRSPKLPGHSMQHGACCGKIFGAKKYPRDNDQEKCHQASRVHACPAKPPCLPAHPRTQRLKGMVDHKVKTVKRPPDNKCPPCAVPKPAQQHGDYEIEIAPCRSFPVAAKRNVQVVTKKCGQRHVPASPKLNYIHRFVGRVEIEWYLDVEAKRLACTRFRRHRVRCFNGTGGASWSGGSLRASSSLRRCG